MTQLTYRGVSYNKEEEALKLGSRSFCGFLLLVSEQPCRVAIGGVAPQQNSLQKRIPFTGFK